MALLINQSEYSFRKLCLTLGISFFRELEMRNAFFKSLIIEFLLYRFVILDVQCTDNFLSFLLT